MSLLALENVATSVRDRGRTASVLRDVNLQLDRGEYVVVWGLRSSGRSTLLRVAAGVQAPDTGSVRFEGRELRAARGAELGQGIGYCQKRLGSGECRTVREQVTMGLLARGSTPANARHLAAGALERCGALDLSRAPLTELDRSEVVRVALARTLALEPKLLVIDEPTNGVELMARDEILLLLRSIADDGVAVLASAGEPAGLSGADRTLALSDGELRGELAPVLAPVVPLRRSA
jgi:energy-coupling factor transporter ATP-binding protein EcfA2